MRTRLLYFKKKLVIFSCILLCLSTSQKCFSQGDIVPQSETGFTGGGITCQGATAQDLVFDFNTGTCGTFPFSPVDVIVAWFSNTINSTAGGTQVAQQIATSSTTTFNYTASTVSTGTLYYYVEVSWGSGVCATPGSFTSSTTQIVTVNPLQLASVSISASATSICAGTPVTFTALPINGGTTPSYQWQVNGFNAGTDAPTFTSGTLVNGDVVTVIMTPSVNDCISSTPATSNSINMAVFALQPASVSISASATTICAGTSVTFTAVPVNGGASISYQWKVNGVNAGTDNPVFTTSSLLNGAIVTVEMTADPSDCTSGSPATSNNITMTVNALQPVSVTIASSATTICVGTAVTFTATPVNGGAAPGYQWKVNGINAGTNSNIFTSSTLANNDLVTVVLTSNSTPCATGNPATSNGILMAVNPILTASVSIAASATNICAGSLVTFTATPANGGSSPSYQWKVNGGNVGANSPVFTSTTLVTGNSVTVVMTSNATPCLAGSPATSNAIVMTVNPIPTAVVMTPASATICQGTIQSLNATSGTTTTFSTGTISVGIPDNTATGISSTIGLGGIPAGAVVNSVSVTFNITHLNVGDLVVNLKAPNLNILNLANRDGGTGDNFTNTIVSSTGAVTVSTGVAPFSSTFLPDGIVGVGSTINTSNVALFSSLFSVANGNWVLSVRDAAAGTAGTITGWSISINWGYPITWSPITDLYSNAGATVAYTNGQILSTVYANPSAAGSQVYIATANHPNGCTRTNSVTLTVNPTATVSASPASQSKCTGSPITQIDITNPNAVPGTVFTWVRTTPLGLAGIATSGSGSSISGTFTNSTTAAITTTFTITATVGTCSSNTTVTVTVNPIPTISVTNSNQTVCGLITNMVITNPNGVVGTVFNWTRDNTVNLTGIAASGTGTPVSGTFVNNTNVQQTTIFTITASLAGCSSSTTATVTVNPKPTVNATALTQTICSGAAIGQIDITNPNSVGGTVFSWTRDNTVNLTGMAASGTGAAITGNLTNNTAIQQTTIFTITATSGSCASTTTVNVKVNPTPIVNNIINQAFCQNQNGSAVVFASNVAGATFSWTSTADVGFGTSGNGNIPGYVAINSPVTATVSVTATANGCPGPVKTFTITVNPLPTVTISADYCLVPGKVRLTANPLPAGTYTYLWTTGAATSFIDVDIAGSYGVTVTNSNGCKATNTISVATELAVNGDFEAGNTGFTTGYNYNAAANGLQPEGNYAVNNNPNFNHTAFYGTDHTTGTGKMMIINGLVGPTVWQETVTVIPNTTYYFSAWALSMNNVSPFAQLQFKVNGAVIGVSAVLVAGVNNNASNTNWQRFYGTWSSGALTAATCSIVDLQGALGGNDFALDDISISTLSPAPFFALPSVAGGGTSVCQGSTLNLAANLSGGSSPYIFSWTGPAGFTSNQQNPVIPTAAAANSGTYTVSVTDFYGCVIAASRNITVTAPPAAPTPVTATPATVCIGSGSNLNGTTPPGTQSDFTGFYAAANWTIANNPGLTGGSVNLAFTPTVVAITSGNNSIANGNTDFTITNGPVAGNYTFNWSYTATTDLPANDIPQYAVNGGAATNLPGFITGGSITQSGTASIAVPAGQTFTLRMRTLNGTLGAATVRIYNFAAPIISNISWYNVPTGGVSLGNSASSVNFPLTPGSAGVNTYYAEAISAIGCVGSARTPVSITVNQPSAAPTILTASPTVICNGSSSTLTQAGGSLGTGASWKWYLNNTYTTLVGTGTGANASLTVSPVVTTTYFLRAEGAAVPCTPTATGPVAGVTVMVNQPSVAPTILNASVNPTCRGNSTTLTQTGGSLGTGASWKWYSDAAYTIFAGNGAGASASLAVSPLLTTTYYLRAEGGTAPCTAVTGGPVAGITITVNQPSAAPTILTASPTVICNGNSSTLTQAGGSLGTGASWKWYSNNTYTTLVGTGTGANASLTVSPTVTTTYYLRAEGATTPCAATITGPVAGVTVTVNQPSVAPTALVASPAVICEGTSTTLTQTGGSLGTGASWKWYTDAAYTSLAGAGAGATASLTVSPLVTTTYYVRAEGATAPCTANVAGPASGITVTVNKKSVNPASATASPTTICEGSTATLTLGGGGTGTAETISWYTGSCGGTLAGTGNNLSVAPVITTTYYGRYENGAPCNFNTTCVQVTVNVTKTGTWLGITTNWNNPVNWCGGVPNASTDVLIPVVGSGKYPNVNTADGMAHDITMAAGTSLIVHDQALQVGGVITNNGGVFDITDGVLELNGSGTAQQISGSMFLNNSILDLRISNSNGVNITGINDTLKLSGLLKFGVSDATLNTNNNLTLLSTAMRTASVGDMTNNGVNSNNHIIGNVTVERYIPNHFKAWQFLAAPTSGQTVNAAWQEGNTPLSNSNNPGYGTIITSNIPGAVALGFDVYTAAGPTMKTYDSTSNGWVGIANPGIQIANKKGYMLFVRGDRSVTAFNQPATATVLRTTGKLFTNGLDAPPITNLDANTFESIGNPYASAIDFDKVTKTGGVQDIFYVWDPKLTTSTYSAWGLGAYQTIIGPGPNYTVVPGGGSYNGPNPNTDIQSGQAFFVHAPFNPGSVSFTETAKVNGSKLVTRPANNDVTQLRNNLYVMIAGDPVLLDGTLSQFDAAYANSVDALDVTKLNNNSENLAMMRDGKKLVAERRSEIQLNDTIFYNLGQLRVQQYRFEFIPSHFDQPGIIAFMEDNYLHSSTVLNMHDTTRVMFNIINDPGSYAADRFKVVFKRPAPVPVTFTAIAASRNNDKTVTVTWKIENEINIQRYTVERSSDGRNFNGIITKDPLTNNGSNRFYSENDLSALSTDNFYRIKALSVGGAVQYSAVVKVAALKDKPGINVYPNPVTGHVLQLQFTDQPEGKYNIVLLYSDGKQQQISQVLVQASQAVYAIEIPQLLAAGIYRLQITGPGNETIFKTIRVSE